MCALTAAGIKEDVWCLFLHVVFPLQPQPPGTQRHLTAIRTRGKGMKTNTVVWSSGFLAFVKRSSNVLQVLHGQTAKIRRENTRETGSRKKTKGHLIWLMWRALRGQLASYSGKCP